MKQLQRTILSVLLIALIAGCGTGGAPLTEASPQVVKATKKAVKTFPEDFSELRAAIEAAPGVPIKVLATSPPVHDCAVRGGGTFSGTTWFNCYVAGSVYYELPTADYLRHLSVIEAQLSAEGWGGLADQGPSGGDTSGVGKYARSTLGNDNPAKLPPLMQYNESHSGWMLTIDFGARLAEQDRALVKLDGAATTAQDLVAGVPAGSYILRVTFTQVYFDKAQRS